MAQDVIEIDQLQVDIWPEYDQPAVLVLYRFTLAPEVSMPARMTMRIPREAGEPFNVAMKDVDGLLYSLDYTSHLDGEWLEISFTALSQELQIEYYDPRLEITQYLRDFEYVWPSDYTVKSMVIRVQQPLNVTSFEASTEMGSGQLSEDGLIYYSSDLGEVKAGSPFTPIRIQYEKADDSLSAGFQSVQPAETIPEPAASALVPPNILPWLFGTLGALLIAGGAFWYWRSGVGSAEKPDSTRKRHTSSLKRDTGGDSASVYCHKCGKRSTPGDAFCRTCGTKLRLDED